MFLKAEFFVRWGRVGLLASGVALATAVLAACASCPAPPIVPAAALIAPAQPAAPISLPEPEPEPESAPAPAPVAEPSAASEAMVRMLAYADRVRLMSAAELGQEVARLGKAVEPADQMRMALVLSHQRQSPELVRAHEWLTRLLANNDAQARMLHPLARLLAARFGEQRRVEDLLEKQNQQTRDLQRRLDQTNERLEALKAIERSMTSRPPAPAASAPASRSHAPAP
ncbi:MAG: hypothetical protein ABIQ90_12530 [Polaromonas sp.]